MTPRSPQPLSPPALAVRPQQPDDTDRAADAHQRAPYASEAARWQAVCERDAGADAHFVYGVRTTRVYARPSALARRPRRENVVFFDSAQAAEAAGYRASRRHQADQSARAADRAAWVAQACRLIEQTGPTDTLPSLAELAAQAGLSAHHFHRVFRAETGLTPKAYAAAHRARRLRQALLDDARVTDAIYDAGFQSNSRFYDTVGQRLGMGARAFQAGGTGVQIHFALGQCALGAILVAQSAQGICAIALGDDPELLLRELQDQFPRAQLVGGDAHYERLVAQVVGFVEAPQLGLNLPLDVRGTAFQERVWQALREVPPGSTVSYAEIAARIGSPQAVRAVAQACAANRLAVAIPCHRVVRRDGALSGYRWGVARKRLLLQREGALA
ncbi:bifunctional transcriptional regulator/O6-methylguanine-DNA methyltransferase [Comamonas serinivorans]|uniref:Bifunctional transcriptional regulator/O6-methylguanine-DNA methyltransferase n=1 Tax=Comamonas serinivorans TaxID=1082851 RepID=A0A1Y0ETH1_9BURK|nr:bifunctional DNA-binding transcriptional regulator/O6-methylguanine-DNA methyltransferase Ada [Comamonas serinivorans]ARU06876.1 bifunctional transcriptional regulator/O6-methylguanine-DNA methyltransferase [Comamonas serinivorans]